MLNSSTNFYSFNNNNNVNNKGQDLILDEVAPSLKQPVISSLDNPRSIAQALELGNIVYLREDWFERGLLPFPRSSSSIISGGGSGSNNAVLTMQNLPVAAASQFHLAGLQAFISSYVQLMKSKRSSSKSSSSNSSKRSPEKQKRSASKLEDEDYRIGLEDWLLLYRGVFPLLGDEYANLYFELARFLVTQGSVASSRCDNVKVDDDGSIDFVDWISFLWLQLFHLPSHKEKLMMGDEFPYSRTPAASLSSPSSPDHHNLQQLQSVYSSPRARILSSLFLDSASVVSNNNNNGNARSISSLDGCSPSASIHSSSSSASSSILFSYMKHSIRDWLMLLAHFGRCLSEDWDEESTSVCLLTREEEEDNNHEVEQGEEQQLDKLILSGRKGPFIPLSLLLKGLGCFFYQPNVEHFKQRHSSNVLVPVQSFLNVLSRRWKTPSPPSPLYFKCNSEGLVTGIEAAKESNFHGSKSTLFNFDEGYSSKEFSITNPNTTTNANNNPAKLNFCTCSILLSHRHNKAIYFPPDLFYSPDEEEEDEDESTLKSTTAASSTLKSTSVAWPMIRLHKLFNCLVYILIPLEHLSISDCCNVTIISPVIRSTLHIYNCQDLEVTASVPICNLVQSQRGINLYLDPKEEKVKILGCNNNNNNNSNNEKRTFFGNQIQIAPFNLLALDRVLPAPLYRDYCWKVESNAHSLSRRRVRGEGGGWWKFIEMWPPRTNTSSSSCNSPLLNQSSSNNQNANIVSELAPEKFNLTVLPFNISNEPETESSSNASTTNLLYNLEEEAEKAEIPEPYKSELLQRAKRVQDLKGLFQEHVLNGDGENAAAAVNNNDNNEDDGEEQGNEKQVKNLQQKVIESFRDWMRQSGHWDQLVSVLELASSKSNNNND